MSASQMNATQIAEEAFAIINVFIPGEAVPAADLNFAVRSLNRLVNSWGPQPSMAMFTDRYRLDLVADQGGPTNPYLVGTGPGEFNIPRPATQAMVAGANLVLTNPDPEVRIPLTILTTSAYDALAVPDLSGQPAAVYYNPSWRSSVASAESGAFCLWPVPSTATNDLELFVLTQTASFDDLTTVYLLHDGYSEALIYNLALRLAGPYGHPMSEDDKTIARLALEVVQRGNVQLSDLPNDAMRAFGWRRRYNIEAGY